MARAAVSVPGDPVTLVLPAASPLSVLVPALATSNLIGTLTGCHPMFYVLQLGGEGGAMEQRVSLREVNQNLARYVKAVEAGERIVITRRGKPIALLSPLAAEERTLSAAQKEALERLLNQSYHLGGQAPLRDELHER